MLGQPDWRKNSGQFSQKNLWRDMVVNGEFVGNYGWRWTLL